VGWDAGLEINWAVTSAGTLDETAVMHKLQHLDINTLGIVWARTPANYENISQGARRDGGHRPRRRRHPLQQVTL